jgi:hypothetical protein
MAHLSENEKWVIEAGGAVIEKKADSGTTSLSPWETLVYSFGSLITE